MLNATEICSMRSLHMGIPLYLPLPPPPAPPFHHFSERSASCLKYKPLFEVRLKAGGLFSWGFIVYSEEKEDTANMQ